MGDCECVFLCVCNVQASVCVKEEHVHVCVFVCVFTCTCVCVCVLTVCVNGKDHCVCMSMCKETEDYKKCNATIQWVETSTRPLEFNLDQNK